MSAALLQPRRVCELRSPASLLLVVAVHLVLAWAALSLRPDASVSLPQPLQVSLISAETLQPAPPTPRAAPIKPLTPHTPPPVLATPRELPGTAPQAPQPVPVPAPAAAPSIAPAANTTAPAAPVVPPRFDADYLDNPAPPYPGLSRRLGEEGRVLLRVRVQADGSAAQVELSQSSGFARLDNAALETVRRWRFVPARQGEEKIAAWVRVPIAFSLSNQP